jgi:predicted phage gp36 major capsid-like protein
MLPMEQAPPGLAELFGGAQEAPLEEPDEIDVTPPGMEEEEESDADLLRVAIEALEKAQRNESDDADSATLAKIVHELYKLTSGQQDAEVAAMGGKPKETRALQRVYGT